MLQDHRILTISNTDDDAHDNNRLEKNEKKKQIVAEEQKKRHQTKIASGRAGASATMVVTLTGLATRSTPSAKRIEMRLKSSR